METSSQFFSPANKPFGAWFLSAKVKNTDIKLVACQRAVWSTESEMALGKGLLLLTVPSSPYVSLQRSEVCLLERAASLSLRFLMSKRDVGGSFRNVNAASRV